MTVSHDGRPCTIVLHDDRVTRVDVLAGERIMHVGEFAYLTSPGSKRLCIAPAGLTTSTHEISLHISLAKRFGFENRTSGHIQIIEDPDVCTATHVELFFRDQYLSRADMWQLMGRVQDTVVYHGQVMNYLGSGTAEVKQIYIAGREVDSAISNHPLTKPIFRSGSARYTILIEISTEMLEHWLEGDLMYERLISGFLPDLFNRWERSKVKHQVTVILFGRIRTVVSNKLHSSNGDLKAEDFFHILVSEVASTSWRDIMRSLKQAFNSSTLERSVSLAANSNMLEAIHLTAMDYADDQQDAHLLSTGTSIIAVTAGAGLFEADHTLLKQTTDLLVGNSIGVDIVALSPKPLHPVPLFQYDNHGSVEFALPHWVDISFWKGPHDVTNSTWSLTDSKAPVSDVALPFLRDGGWSQVEASMMDYYDQHVLGGSVVTTDDDLGKVKTATPSDAVGSVETMKGVNMPSTSTLEAAIDPAPETQAPSARPSVKEPLSRSKRERLPPHPLMQQGRKISVGPKGLAPSRGVASTTVSATYAQHEKDLWSLSSPSPSDHASGLTRALRASLARKPSQQSLISRTSEGDHEQSSRPINISATSEHRTGESGDPAGDVEQKIAATLVGNVLQNDSSLSTTPKAGIRYPRKASLDDSLDMLSPWVMLLNPCNPRRDNMRVASQYRKWQHVFPRAVSSGSFKWSSMCSPATLPLTAEYKPSATELDTLYNKKVRRHIISDSASLKDETARVLVERLIDMRLIKGFQIVAIRNSGSDQTYQSRNKPTLMALGRHYHEVQRLSDFEVQIVQYEPKSGIGSKEEEGQHYLTSYKPRLRIGIGVLTEPEISYHSDTPLSDWTALDEHILGLSPMPEAHVTFKVRLILIPVEIGAQTRLVGLSDDERHIEGIQRLTTTWQRQRYFSAEDQSRHASLTKSKASGPAADRDPNPLAIEYQTKDPSVVVNAHGPILSTQLEDGDLVPPLFAESEKHHSSNFDIAKLVKQMQELPPYGVEMRDRRWLTLTHLKCFRGDEMTTWLLSVFKDLDLREDAVTLGNELMHRGIFNHVRSKHKFRDGHYFYQISSSHRTTEYPDTQGLFSKAPWRSVPSTPATESMKSPMMRPVTGDSSSSSSKDTPSNAPTDQRQLLLSQVMQYNVDPQKKSDHLQIIDLHYDRIHNPENCYHIQLEWLGTSAKLIREAISRWSGVVEGYGLRLMQVPLHEACKFRERHPFDQPQFLRLAARPPDKVMATPVATPILEPHSSPARTVEDRYAYHKAVLRNRGFVLDYEAATTFTSDLHVSYSWGPPAYTYTQFVHKTGLVLAQITGDEKGDFILLPNRLAVNRIAVVSRQNHNETVEGINNGFKEFVRNAEGLRQFYSEVDRLPRGPTPSPYSRATLAADSDVPPMQLPPELSARNHRQVLKEAFGPL